MGIAPTLRLGGLVSGGGRTLLNIASQIRSGCLKASIEVVISSRAEAAAVARCRDEGLPVEIVERRALDDASFHRRIADVLRAAHVDLVCMAGFLSFWKIPKEFAGRVLNIHPALLPEFGGRGYFGDRVHRAVLTSGARESGCSVHFADDEYDHGPIVLQRRVPVIEGDDVAALAARVFEQECLAYPEALQLFIDGRRPLPEPSLVRTC